MNVMNHDDNYAFDTLPVDMRLVVEHLDALPSQHECVRYAYALLTKKYRGRRIETFLRITDILNDDIHRIWAREGFLHCTNMNRVMCALLLNTQHFTRDDVGVKWTRLWFIFPHQYVRVKVNDKWIAVDVWGFDHGIVLGDYAHGLRG